MESSQIRGLNFLKRVEVGQFENPVFKTRKRKVPQANSPIGLTNNESLQGKRDH